MKWARIEGDTCVEFVTDDPAGRYHEDFRWVTVPEHLRAWVDHAYVVGGADTVEPPSMAYLVDQLLAKVEDRRWRVEVGGTTLPDGTLAPTTDRAKILWLGAFPRASRLAATDPDALITWKIGRGEFERHRATVVVTRANAIADHVQACIDREAEISAAIKAAALAAEAVPEGSRPDYAAVVATYAAEIDQGWPS